MGELAEHGDEFQSRDREIRIDRLVMTARALFRVCRNEAQFDSMFELLLLHEDSGVVVEVESRFWQTIPKISREHDSQSGSHCWRLLE